MRKAEVGHHAKLGSFVFVLTELFRSVSYEKKRKQVTAFTSIVVCFTARWKSTKSRSKKESPLTQNIVMQRVIVIGDSGLEYRLLEEILALGATGYTCYEVRGRGARGIRPRHAEPGNIKIEIIATREVAQQILEHVAKHYFEQYAMIAILDEVEVLNGEKFGANTS